MSKSGAAHSIKQVRISLKSGHNAYQRLQSPYDGTELKQLQPTSTERTRKDEISDAVLRRFTPKIVNLGVPHDSYLKGILDHLIASHPFPIITTDIREAIMSQQLPQDRMRLMIDHVEKAGFMGFEALRRGLKDMKVAVCITLAKELQTAYVEECAKQNASSEGSSQDCTEKKDKDAIDKKDCIDHTKDTIDRKQITSEDTTTDQSERSIVFLGRSGGGKTTLINAMANYSKFMSEEGEKTKTFNEAFAEKLCELPMKIRVCGVDPTTGKRCLYDIGGERELEAVLSVAAKPGDRVTTKIMEHKIKYINHVLRLIDTPGFCSYTDTVTTNEMNMRQIAHHLTEEYPYLNAVAIVIPASENRLTDEVKQYFRNILEILTRELGVNIIVCITYSDCGSSETEPMVTDFVKEITGVDLPPGAVRFYENRGVKELTENIMRARRQVTTKEPTEDEIKALGRKWDSSADAMVEMINYVANLEKCQPEKLVYISRVREQVDLLLKPMEGVIMGIIENKKALLSAVLEAKKELAYQASKAKKSNFMEGLNYVMCTVKRITFVSRKLPHYVTVCRSSKCTKVNTNSTTETKGHHYVVFEAQQVCHQDCKEHWFTQKCDMLSTGSCTKCYCSAGDHRRTCYATDVKEINEKFPINGNTIRHLNDKLQEEDKELHTYVKKMAVFMVFMKEHALVQMKDPIQASISSKITTLQGSCSRESSGDQNVENVELEEYQKVQQLHAEYVKEANESPTTLLEKVILELKGISNENKDEKAGNGYGEALRVAQKNIHMTQKHDHTIINIPDGSPDASPSHQ